LSWRKKSTGRRRSGRLGARLTPEQFRITRKKGTERAFTGKYDKHYEKGVYRCVCCETGLFRSETKYESGTGWPSFFAPIAKENIRTENDTGWFTKRIEVLCARCDAHLGHVFEDGPKPTGLRYCMNSAAFTFAKMEGTGGENGVPHPQGKGYDTVTFYVS
jgi:peptide-methionine (R)-S-oxide reductase